MLLFEIAGDRQVIADGAWNLIQQDLHLGGHRPQIASRDVGADRHPALLVFAVDQNRSAARFGHDDVAQGHPFTGGRCQRKVENFVDGTLFGILELHQNAIGIARRAVLAGFGAGHRGLQQLGDVAHAQAEIGDFVAVYADFLLGYAGFEAGLNVCDARDIRNRLGHAPGQRVERGKRITPDLDRQAFVPAQEPVQDKLPLRRPDTDLHAGDTPFQAIAQVLGDFHIGACAPGGRQQRDAYFTLRARVRPPAGGADADHRRHRLGDGRFNDLLHFTYLPIDQLQPGPDTHLPGDADFALITGGQKFTADQGQEQQTCAEHGRRPQNGDQAMVQDPTQQTQVSGFETREDGTGGGDPAVRPRRRPLGVLPF